MLRTAPTAQRISPRSEARSRWKPSSFVFTSLRSDAIPPERQRGWWQQLLALFPPPSAQLRPLRRGSPVAPSCPTPQRTPFSPAPPERLAVTTSAHGSSGHGRASSGGGNGGLCPWFGLPAGNPSTAPWFGGEGSTAVVRTRSAGPPCRSAPRGAAPPAGPCTARPGERAAERTAPGRVRSRTRVPSRARGRRRPPIDSAQEERMAYPETQAGEQAAGPWSPPARPAARRRSRGAACPGPTSTTGCDRAAQPCSAERRGELPRIHRSKLDGAGCRAAGESGGCAGVRRAVPERAGAARGR